MIDPSWEYYTPDPEVYELVKESGNLSDSLDCFLDFGNSESSTKNILNSMRFGKGDPDRYIKFTLGYGYESWRNPSDYGKSYHCIICKMLFFSKEVKKFCSKDCLYVHKKNIAELRVKEKLLIREDLHKKYRQKIAENCVKYLENIKAKLSELWSSEMTIKEIAEVLKVNQATITRWKRSLKLPARISAKLPPVTISCEKCGINFTDLASRKKRFCSVKCSSTTGGRKRKNP